MGTCEDSCPLNLDSDINLQKGSNETHHNDYDDDDDGHVSSEQALVQKLENTHLEEDEKGEGEEVGGEVEESQSDSGGEGEEEKKGKEEELENENGDHPYPLRPHVEDCSFYMKTGFCKFGRNCRFNHPLNRMDQVVDVDRMEYVVQGSDDTGKIECKYYRTPGGCKYGDACRYKHSVEKINTEPLELNFLGLPIRMGEKECPFYMRTGSCGYGANCRFHHPDPTTSSQKPNSVIPNGASLQAGNSFSTMNIASALPHSISNSSNSENLSSYLSWMNSLYQGMPQLPRYNQYQVALSLTGNNMNSQPRPSVTNPLKNADTFDHDQQLQHNDGFPERPGQPECDYFMKTGTCKFGSQCKFHHPKSRSHFLPNGNGANHNLVKDASHVAHNTQIAQMDEFPERPGQRECAYFMRTGKCKYKSECRYHHPKSRALPLAPSMSDMNGLTSGLAPVLPHELMKLPGLYPNHLNQKAKPFKYQQQPTAVEEFPERPGQSECEYFMKTGDCKYKSSCRFHHPKGPRSQASAGSDYSLNELGLPIRPGAASCRNYEQLGICKYGPRCQYNHSVGYNSAAVPETPAPESPPGNDAGLDGWEDGWVM